MSDTKEFQGKNLDEAIESACKHYDLKRDKLEIEIVSGGSSGIFGLVGVKPAVVRAKPRGSFKLTEEHEERKPARADKAEGHHEHHHEHRRERHHEGHDRPEREDRPERKPARESAPVEAVEASAPVDAVAAPEGGEAQGERGEGRSRRERGRRGRGRGRGEGRGEGSGEAQPGSQADARPAEGRSENRSEGRSEGRGEGRGRGRNSERNSERGSERQGERGGRGRGGRSGGEQRVREPRREAAGEGYGEEENGAPQGIGHLDQALLEQVALEVTTKILAPLSEEAKISVQLLHDRVLVRIDDPDNSGLLIGREGQTLASIQYLVNRLVSKRMDASVRVQIDTGDYRENQDEKLRQIARHLADKATASGRTQSTRPMSSYHRRVVHLTLQEDEFVFTRSKGEGAMKRVLIVPKRPGGGEEILEDAPEAEGQVEGAEGHVEGAEGQVEGAETRPETAAE